MDHQAQPSAPNMTSPAVPSFRETLIHTLGWVIGLAIVLVCGWGFVFLTWSQLKYYKVLDPEWSLRGHLPVILAAVAVSSIFFYLLESRFWLSRLSGFTVYPNANRVESAILYAVLGVPGMFMRSSVGKPSPEQVKAALKHHSPGHAPREALETIVFVVVLVFLLKQFVVEAFVIPTGSMAETLYGYQKLIVCDDCGYEFPLNSSDEVDPMAVRGQHDILGYCCPNCRYRTTFPLYDAVTPFGKTVKKPLSPPNNSGDRVLVHKAMQHIDPAEPGDVVVFKFPDTPQVNYNALNYIKRMWGVGGDTIAIWNGDLYVCKTLRYPPPPSVPESDYWKTNQTRITDPEAINKFVTSRDQGFPIGVGGFELIRKPEQVLLAMRRIVYDADHPSQVMQRNGVPPRWKPETNDWSSNDPALPTAFSHDGAALGWLRYRHIAIPHDARWQPDANTTYEPRLIDNFMGYNGEWNGHSYTIDHRNDESRDWVGDLIIECRVELQDADSEVTLELSKGANRYQAVFSNNQVSLIQTGPGGKSMGSWPARFGGPGTYELRLANVDSSLKVWIDHREVPLGPEANYPPYVPKIFDPKDEWKEGWTTANDKAAPASVGIKGRVTVSKLKLFRDTFFVHESSPFTPTLDDGTKLTLLHAQPGHYICLGDNSTHSADGRTWGAVPERLMLGKAVFVFWPSWRIGNIR